MASSSTPPDSSKGRSWDDVFAYKTNVQVVIRDRRLGLLQLAFSCAITAYIVGYQILTQKNYLACYPASLSVTPKVRGGLVAAPDFMCARHGMPRDHSFSKNVKFKFKFAQLDDVAAGYGILMSNAASELCPATNPNIFKYEEPDLCDSPQYRPFDKSCNEKRNNQSNQTIPVAKLGPAKNGDKKGKGFETHETCETIFEADQKVTWPIGTTSLAIVLSRWFKLNTSDAVHEIVGNANDLHFDLHGMVYSSPYIKNPRVATMGGAIRDLPFRLVDRNGDIVKKCYRYGRQKYDLLDSCKSDVLTKDQPCEFQPGDAVVLPLEALVASAGWTLSMTLREAMEKGVAGAKEMVESCVRDNAYLIGDTFISDKSFERARADGWIDSLVEGILSTTKSMKSRPNLASIDDLTEMFRQRCLESSIVDGAASMLLHAEIGNMGSQQFRTKFLQYMTPKVPTITLSALVGPPNSQSGLPNHFTTINPTDRDYPKFVDGLDASVHFGARRGTVAYLAHSGDVCEFNFAVLLTTLTSALGLIAVAAAAVEFCMLNLSNLRKLYKLEKFQFSANYTALLQKAEENQTPMSSLELAADRLERQGSTAISKEASMVVNRSSPVKGGGDAWGLRRRTPKVIAESPVKPISPALDDAGMKMIDQQRSPSPVGGKLPALQSSAEKGYVTYQIPQSPKMPHNRGAV
ncbi:ATP P2X receptor [Pycnococcus provasolii]